jgi:hypothetical protein
MACASPALTLPDYGIYVIASVTQIALPLFTGGLEHFYLPNMPDVRDSSPRILYRQMDKDIGTLAVQNVT